MIGMSKFTEEKIQKMLRGHTSGNYKFRASNLFVYLWESDFWVLKKSGFAIEYEIKISKSDFKADFKKIDKHDILSSGKYPDRLMWRKKKPIPNRFYYVVPSGLIETSEVPKYAGLIYVSNGGITKEVKKAPIIHREKQDYSDVLCTRFWYTAINQRLVMMDSIQSIQGVLNSVNEETKRKLNSVIRKLERSSNKLT